MSLRALACVVVTLVGSVSSAADLVLSAPVGHRVLPSVADTAGSNFAFAVVPTAGAGDARIVQFRSGSIVQTTVTGTVYGLTYSLSGSHILVTHGDAGSPTVTLIAGPTGVAAWSKSDTRGYGFSSGGQRVLATRLGPIAEAEAFNLDGTRWRRLNSTDIHCVGAVALDSPSRIVLASPGLIDCLDPVAGTSAWRHSVAAQGYGFHDLRFLAGRMLASIDYGGFKLLNLDGSVACTYDPAALGASDPAHDWPHYAQYRPYETSSADWLLLFDGSSEGMFLNVGTGALVQVTLDVSVPSGFWLRPHADKGRLVLFGFDSIRVRSVPSPP